MRPNLTVDRRAALCARVGWVLDVLHELLGERYREFRRHKVAAADFADLPRDCQDAILQAETLKADRSKRLVSFVEAAKNLIRTVVEADDGARQVEPWESLARRMRSWATFKRAAKQWCERHKGR
jgi:hypothetical protein